MDKVAKTLCSHVSRITSQRVLVASANFSGSSSTIPTNGNRIEVAYEELSDLLTFNQDLALIDVRSQNELDTYGSIPGSVNIPLNEVKAALQLPEHEFLEAFFMPKPSKSNRNLVFFARGPNASSAAVEIAHRLGYKGSRQYSGGWEDYCNKTGLPLKKRMTAGEQQSSTFISSSYNNNKPFYL